MIIHILMGLPGSGKDFYISEEFNDTNRFVIVNLDDGDKFPSNLVYFQDIVVNGLILDNETLQSVIEKIIKKYKNKSKYFKVIFFEEDRETCINNDIMRNRPVLATETIKHAKFEFPSDDLIKKYKLEIEKVKIHKVTKSDIIAKEYANHPGLKLKSDGWVLGGESWNYKGNRFKIDPEEQKEFTELYELLEKVYPSITLIQYRKLFKKLVKTEDYNSGDYYSNLLKRRYVCYLPELFDFIKQLQEGL